MGGRNRERSVCWRTTAQPGSRERFLACSARVPCGSQPVRGGHLALAAGRGVCQYVVLGAGLDTFAYRNPFRGLGLRVFEVDHPATQEWKLATLREANIAITKDVTFVPVDLESHALREVLLASDFDCDRPAFFSWLGVTPYLSRAAFDATMEFIAAMPAGSGIAFDYAIERSLLNPAQQLALDAMAERVARAGEPFRLFFNPAALANDMEALGFIDIENLSGPKINERYFGGRTDGLAVSGGGHLLSAQRGTRSTGIS